MSWSPEQCEWSRSTRPIATAPMMKAYLIDAWEAGMEEVGRVFESINLAILIATDAGDVGLDSSDCMGVFQERPFSSKTARSCKRWGGFGRN